MRSVGPWWTQKYFQTRRSRARGGRCCECIGFLPPPEGQQDGGQICRPGLRLRVPPHSARFPSPAVAESPRGGDGGGGGGGVSSRTTQPGAPQRLGGGRRTGSLVRWDQEAEGSAVSGAAMSRSAMWSGSSNSHWTRSGPQGGAGDQGNHTSQFTASCTSFLFALWCSGIGTRTVVVKVAPPLLQRWQSKLFLTPVSPHNPIFTFKFN